MQEEYDKIVDEVSDEYEYSDDLRNTLKRVLPAMLAESNPESKETFYKMLRETPITVIAHDSKVTKKELDAQYIGDLNPHVKDLESDAMGEYGRAVRSRSSSYRCCFR